MIGGYAAAAGGIAVLAVGIYVWTLHGRIDGLETELRACEQAKAVVESNREQLRLEIETQNRATRARERALGRAASRQAELAQEARQKAEQAERTLTERLASIERTAVPETMQERLEQCERGRQHLVR